MPKRKRHNKTGHTSPAVKSKRHADSPSLLNHLRRGCLAATVALLVATILSTTDTSPELDTFVVLGMLWPVLLAVWALFAFSSSGGEIRWCATDIAVAVVLILIVVSGIVAIASGHGSPRPTINMIWRWLACGIAYFLVRQLVRRQVEVRAVVAVMISVAVGLSVLGCYQYFVGYPQKENRWKQLSEEEKRQEILDAEIAYFAPGTPQRKQFEDRWLSDEPLATFSLTNSLAGYLAPWLIVGLWILVEGWRDQRSPRVMLWMWAGCLVSIAACLLLTQSRTATLATALGVGIIVFLQARKRWQVRRRVVVAALLLVVVLGLSGLFVMGAVDSQVLGGARRSVQYRIEYWQATAMMIRDQPLFGCGPGNYQNAYTAYKLPQASEVVADPHNLVFEVWSNAGTLCLLAFAVLAWLFVRDLRQNPRDHSLNADSDTSDERPQRNEPPAGEESASPQFVLIGGLVGIPVALLSGALVAQSRNAEFFYTLIPAMLAAVALLFPWVRRGSVSRRHLVAGLIVLLINLLAAGSLGFPSVAVTAWVLAALMLGMSTKQPQVVRVSRTGSVLVLIGACIVVVVCHQTLYRPVLTRLGAIGLLEEAGGFREAEELLASAAQADPFSAEPWQRLSTLYFNAWRQLQRSEADQEELSKAWKRFELAAVRIRELAPRSSRRHMRIGNICMKAYEISGQREKLSSAIEWYKEASSLYPNNALLQAQLAWAWDLAGDQSRAVQAAKRASELDGLNPHREFKLKNQFVLTGLPDEPQKDAEQVVVELRKPEKE